MISAIKSEIDLTGVDLNVETAQTMPGITAKLAAALSTGAPILVTGVVNDTTPISAMYATIAGTSVILPIGVILTLDPEHDTLTVAS